MMNDALCTYDGRRDEVLVAYLYEDIDPQEREAFERHVRANEALRKILENASHVIVEKFKLVTKGKAASG